MIIKILRLKLIGYFIESLAGMLIYLLQNVMKDVNLKYIYVYILDLYARSFIMFYTFVCLPLICKYWTRINMYLNLIGSLVLHPIK